MTRVRDVMPRWLVAVWMVAIAILLTVIRGDGGGGMLVILLLVWLVATFYAMR